MNPTYFIKNILSNNESDTILSNSDIDPSKQDKNGQISLFVKFINILTLFKKYLIIYHLFKLDFCSTRFLKTRVPSYCNFYITYYFFYFLLHIYILSL